MGYINKKGTHGKRPQIRQVVKTDGFEVVDTGFVIPKGRGFGFMLDTASPTFGWKDLLGQVIPRTTGAGTPTAAAWRGQAFQYSFNTNDVIDNVYHIPHDHLPGSDIYLHIHWGHQGTAISGNFIFDHYVTYAKGHNQTTFPAEINITQTCVTSSIGFIPQYSHHLDEIQLSAASSASMLPTGLIEPDGLIILRTKTTQIPTITGGVVNRPFIFFIDLHYQSTSQTTKSKAPNFWGE